MTILAFLFGLWIGGLWAAAMFMLYEGGVPFWACILLGLLVPLLVSLYLLA